MKNQKYAVSMFLIAMLVTAFAITPVFGSGLKLKMTYGNVDFFPYEVGDGQEAADPPGMAVEVIRQAGKELGIDIEFIREPSRRALASLSQGKVDGAFVYSFKTKRIEFGQYPMKNGKVDGNRRIASVSYYLYKPKGASIDWDGKNFSNVTKPIGFNRGFSIGKDIEEMGIPVSSTGSTGQNLKKLKAGRISAYAGFDVSTDGPVESGKYGDIVKVPVPLASKDYFLMLSNQFIKKHPKTAEQLWDKIGEIRDGMLKKLAPKYYPE